MAGLSIDFDREESGWQSGLKKGAGLSVLVPVYNEPGVVAEVVAGIESALRGLSLAHEIIVIDDGSTDGSCDTVAALANVRLVRHAKNKGYGAALKSGMKNANYEWICITDADGTYPNERIPDLVDKMRGSDMVVGARLGKAVHIPLVRKPAKWVLNQIANYLVREKIPDLNSGFRVFKRSIAEKYLNILPDAFSFTTTITLAMLSDGYNVLYLPIDYHPRTGKSKIRPIHDTMNFLQLIFRTILYFDPLRIFLPMGFSFLSVATGLYAIRVIRGGGFGATVPMIFLAGVQILAIGMLADLIVRRMKS